MQHAELSVSRDVTSGRPAVEYIYISFRSCPSRCQSELLLLLLLFIK